MPNLKSQAHNHFSIEFYFETDSCRREIQKARSANIPGPFSALLEFVFDCYRTDIHGIRMHSIWHGHRTKLMLDEDVSAMEGGIETNSAGQNKLRCAVAGGEGNWQGYNHQLQMLLNLSQKFEIGC